MDHIPADSMAPAHVSPLVPEGIVLEEKMVLTFVKDQPVGIIDPVLARRIVKLRAQRLIVIATSRNNGYAATTKQKGQED